MEVLETACVFVDELIREIPLKMAQISFDKKDWILAKNATEYLCPLNELHLRPYETGYFDIHLVPNSIGLFKDFLTIQTENTELRVPLSHNCVSPELEVSSKSLEFTTFVGCCTLQELSITNRSQTDGFLEVFSENNENEIMIDVSPKKLRICGGKSEKVFVHVKPMIEGDIRGILVLKPLGACQPFEVQIRCTSNPPKVQVSPKNIQKAAKIFSHSVHEVFLENFTPVPIPYTLALESSHFSLNHNSGILEDTANVKIFSYFEDVGTFNAKLLIKSDHLLKVTRLNSAKFFLFKFPVFPGG